MSEQNDERTWAQRIEHRVEAIEAHVGLDKSDETDETAGDGDENGGEQ